MKCPNCQAELLPVDGVLFCLQCGRAIAANRGDKSTPAIEDTSDPLLQKAITDSLGHAVKWKLPVSAKSPKPVTSFAALHHALAAPARSLTPVTAAGVQAAAITVPVVAAPPVPVKPTPEPDEPAPKYGPGSLNLLPGRVKSIRVTPWKLSTPSFGWTMGALAGGLFIAINLGIYGYFNARVYPGVKVGQLNVGGIKESDLPSYLARHLALNGDLTLDVGGSKYVVAGAGLGAPDSARATREAMEAGHNIELPMAGLIAGLVSKPITVHRVVNDAAVKAAAQQMARQVDSVATEPVPMIVGSQAFVIAEKSGEELNTDRAESDISAAVAAGKTQISLDRAERTPVLTANDFQDDLSAAQSRMALSLKLTVGTASYNPSPAQIGSWLDFSGAGKGVAVDQSALVRYVASLPGGFDRNGTYAALLAAVGSGQGLTYTASTATVTATPKPQTASPVWPITTFRYCVAAPSGAEANQLRAVAGSALADPAGWGLGGRVRFEQAESGCNFTFSLVDAKAMALLDQRCVKQSTCKVGNQLELNLSNWQQPPSDWKQGALAYRTELIGHEAGHWLGFDHSSCLGKSSATSVLQAPTLVLDGCSPNWYALTAGQGNKILPGF
jgi:hypothetical protein